MNLPSNAGEEYCEQDDLTGRDTSANAMAGSCFPFPIRVSLLSLYDVYQYSRNGWEMHYAIF